VGVKARRGGTGIAVTDPTKFKCCTESINHLKSMVRRMEFFGKYVFPFGLLSTIKDVRASVNDAASLTSTTGGEDRIWASVATSYNYMSPAHVDDDAFLTAITVSFVPKDYRNNKFFYGSFLSVAVYMCFPEFGIAVGLRPGDVLFFNPQYYHCVSGRTNAYNEDKVYVTSFYMKTMQLGLNDNSIGLENVQTETSLTDNVETERLQEFIEREMLSSSVDVDVSLKDSIPPNDSQNVLPDNFLTVLPLPYEDDVEREMLSSSVDADVSLKDNIPPNDSQNEFANNVVMPLPDDDYTKAGSDCAITFYKNRQNQLFLATNLPLLDVPLSEFQFEVVLTKEYTELCELIHEEQTKFFERQDERKKELLLQQTRYEGELLKQFSQKENRLADQIFVRGRTPKKDEFFNKSAGGYLREKTQKMNQYRYESEVEFYRLDNLDKKPLNELKILRDKTIAYDKKINPTHYEEISWNMDGMNVYVAKSSNEDSDDEDSEDEDSDNDVDVDEPRGYESAYADTTSHSLDFFLKGEKQIREEKEKST
jgi:hypothetical protein